jgi:hypothetical protein
MNLKFVVQAKAMIARSKNVEDMLSDKNSLPLLVVLWLDDF